MVNVTETLLYVTKRMLNAMLRLVGDGKLMLIRSKSIHFMLFTMVKVEMTMLFLNESIVILGYPGILLILQSQERPRHNCLCDREQGETRRDNSVPREVNAP